MRIQLITGEREIDVTTVSIVENYEDNWKMWNCPTCKNPVFQYRGKVIQILPGFIPTEVPVLVQCGNSSCRQKYFIKTILARVL